MKKVKKEVKNEGTPIPRMNDCALTPYQIVDSVNSLSISAFVKLQVLAHLTDTFLKSYPTFDEVKYANYCVSSVHSKSTIAETLDLVVTSIIAKTRNQK